MPKRDCVWCEQLRKRLKVALTTFAKATVLAVIEFERRILRNKGGTAETPSF